MGNTYLNTHNLPALNTSDYNTVSRQRSVGKGVSVQEQTFLAGTKAVSGDFSRAVYGDGPYSLEHPNNTTEMVAQMCDYLA